MATQEKTWNVANRLHSMKDSDKPEVNHIIAGADEIYDDTKGAKQSDINAQTDAALADRYTKDETYNQQELNSLITTPDVSHVSVVATSGTTAVTDVLPATGTADTIYRIGNWDGTQYDPTVYSLYAWNGTAYVCLAVRSFVGEVYDISANHPDGQGNPTPYADLAAALGSDGENIPADIRRGGMSIKFIQSSDNKYVQYRLTTDEFTTDTTQWVIADEGVYVENPEYVYVKTDSEGKILWAIKTDGSIYYGAGCPQQVKDYIEDKISSLSLDEYEDIVTFLNDYLGGDTTLKMMIDGINNSISNLSNTKVDKEEGRSLIDAEYASTKSTVDNPEFLEVTTDSEDKVLEGIQADGTKVIGGDIKVLGNMEVSGVSYKVIENPEYLAAWVDAEDKIIFGLKADGKTYVGDADFLDDIESIKAFLANFNDKNIDWDALSAITAIENSEFIDVETDSEDKLLSSRNLEGVKKEYVGFETPKLSIDGHIVESIKDIEERSEITIDSEERIIAYRDKDGVKHEVTGLHTPNLTADKIHYTENNIDDLKEIIETVTDQIEIEYDNYLPKIEVTSDKLTVVGNTINGLYAVGENAKNKVDCTIRVITPSEMYIEEGCKISYQGNSSLLHPKKGFQFKFAKKHRFNNWLAFKSFHCKGYYNDWMHLRDWLANKIIEQTYNNRNVNNRRPYLAYNDFAPANVGKLVENGALCHVDEFPVELYINGNYWGLYSLRIKKDADNYLLTETNVHHIQVEAATNTLYSVSSFANDGEGWSHIEILNPTEDSGNTEFEEGVEPNAGEVKTAWQDFITKLNALDNNSTVSDLEEFLNIQEWIDAILLYRFFETSDTWSKNTLYTCWDCVVEYNTVTAHWSPLLYDFDNTFQNVATQDIDSVKYQDCPWLPIIKSILFDRTAIRYKELRDAGIFSVDNVRKLVEERSKEIGGNVYDRDINRWQYPSVVEAENPAGLYSICEGVRKRIAVADTLYNYNNN